MRQFKKILVPVDYSSPSDEAVAQAILLARETGARVLFVHVVPPYDPSYFEHLGVSATLDPEVEVKEKEKLDACVSRILGRQRVKHDAEVCWGDPARRIIEFAGERACDLIAIGANGLSNWPPNRLGSVAHKVVQHAGCPVLLVRSPASQQSGGGARKPASAKSSQRRRSA